MNISASYVEYIGSTIARRRLIIFRILGYNLIVTLKITIPFQSETEPDSLYTIITSNLVNSVNSGLFTSYLLTASNNLGITTFANSSITSVQNDAFVIQEPDKRYDTKTSNNWKQYNIIYIIFAVLLFIYAILYFVWLRRKYINKNRRLLENEINIDDVGVRIVEEQVLVNFTGEKIKLKIIN
jgi:magnesium-transporting ATPase (P-type)